MKRRKHGRDITWTKRRKNLAKSHILNRLSSGEGLRKILSKKAYEEMDLPQRSMVKRWIEQDDDGFRALYIEAKNNMCDEKCDYMNDKAHEFLKQCEDHFDIPTLTTMNAIRHEADSIKWTIARLMPKKYGSTFNVDSSDNKKISNIEISFVKGKNKIKED